MARELRSTLLLAFLRRTRISYLSHSQSVSFGNRVSLNLNHGETSRTECDHEEGHGGEEEDRHQSQPKEGARPSSRIIIIIIIIAIDPLQIRGSELKQGEEEVDSPDQH